jgi:hypothetical protein
MTAAPQTSANQYQVNMHSAATTTPSRYGATASRNAAGATRAQTTVLVPSGATLAGRV